ncbi:phage tail spike protein [Clostridium sp. CTA-7]
MLHLYDLNKKKIEGLVNYKDYKIESVLDTGDKTLSFLYPSNLSKSIIEECYIKNKTDEFVIKEVKDDGNWKSVVAVINVEDLEGQAWEHFDCTNQNIEQCLTLAVAGTGWTVEIINPTNKKRTVKKTNCSTWDLIQEAKKVYRLEIEFDTLNKIVKVYERLGSKKGAYFIDSLNLKELEVEANSYDYYTRILAIGKNDIKVLVENYQYSKKIKTLIWKDEKYTDIDSLREDAILKLNELSKPYKSYRASIIDLASISDNYKNILDYKLGDIITLISKDLKIKEEQRIVKIVEYPDDPTKNDCEMANTILSFKELQKEFRDASNTVSNITENNGKISEKAIKEAVDKITIDKVDTKSLNAAVGRIGTLEATTAKISQLDAINANIVNLQSNKANITDLTAANIKVSILEGDTANLQTILSKFISGENGQLVHLTSENVVIDNAVIKSAMIENLDLSKLNAGDISTNKFRIVSDSGKMLIADNTIQINDANRTRVQIGKDASNDYNMYVWDSSGNLMFDATGLKEDGIKNSIIRNDMISDNANITGSKINISSLVTEVNKDTNTSLFKASKIMLDTIGQSLEVSFNNLKTTADITKNKTESNTTQIGVMNGQIETLIKDTIIEEDGEIVKLKDSYSSLKQTVNGISSTVASHTTSITTLGTNVNNAQTTANNANSLADSKAKAFTSTPTTPYKVGDIWTSGPSGDIMKCKVARVSGSYVTSDWEKASKYTDDTKANTVEGNLNTLSGKVTTVESKQASLSQDLSGFKTTVNSTYSTKSELNTVDGKVTNLTTRVANAEQKITDSAIIATVSSTINTAKEQAINSANSATDTKLQSYSTKASMELTASQLRLEFKSTGGNNIIKNSQFKNRIAFWNIHSGTGGAFVVAEDYITRGYQYGFRSSDTKEILFYQDVAVKGNVTYSISAEVMAQQNTLGATLIVQFLASNGSIISTTNLETVVQNTNKKVVSTVVTPANCTSIRLHIRHNGYTNLAYSFIFISNIMINQGYPVPWQPNSDEIIDGNTVVDGNGIEVTFDNGQGKARMGREGFYWKKDGLSKAYHCLFYKGEVFTDANVQNGVLIQLPAEFRGKDFEVIVAPKNIKKEGGFLMYWLNCYYSERNISNGTFKVHGVVDWRAVDNHNMISSTGINVTYVVLA